MAARRKTVNLGSAMQREIEAKFSVASLTPLRAKLATCGQQATPTMHETNRIFDAPGRPLTAADCGLRVRQVRPLTDAAADSAILTFKGPRGGGAFKAREELETTVGAAATLIQILERLGYHTVITYEKRRETWRVGPCVVALDELPRLGEWVEIEGPDEAAVAAVAWQLGLNPAACAHETYVELAARHGALEPDGSRRLAFDD